jgi:hypothetical protein
VINITLDVYKIKFLITDPVILNQSYPTVIKRWDELQTKSTSDDVSSLLEIEYVKS